MLKTVYETLENPAIYNIAQKLLGGDRVYKLLRETIAAQLKDISYNKVLDVGCGTGLFTDCFKSDYTGIDINEEYIKKARVGKRGSFNTGDATVVDFKPIVAFSHESIVGCFANGHEAIISNEGNTFEYLKTKKPYA